MRRISTILGLTFVVAFIFPDPSWAACKFDWSAGAYCGPGKTANRVTDEFVGPFSNACRTHDFCYFAAGEQIAKEIEEGYLRTKSDIAKRRDESRRQCDSYFYESLMDACSQVPAVMRTSCKTNALQYFGWVKGVGWSAFRRSITKAQNCR